MRRTHGTLAAIALLAAAGPITGAASRPDLLRWRDAVLGGDLQFSRSPAQARWTTTAVLPFDPARRLLALGDQLELGPIA